MPITHSYSGARVKRQAISSHEQVLCRLCVLSFRVEVKKKRTQKLCPTNGIQKKSTKVAGR